MTKVYIALEGFFSSNNKGIQNLLEDRHWAIQQAIEELRKGTLNRSHVFNAQGSAETLASHVLGALQYSDQQDAELARLYSAVGQFIEAMRSSGFKSRDYTADNGEDIANHEEVWSSFKD